MPVLIVCAGCGETFYLKPSHAAKGNHRFCSRECRKATTQRKWQRTCERCGATFRKEYASEGRFCSNACYAEYRRSLPPEERTALLANATAVIRGSKRSHDDLCKRARTKQERAKLSGDESMIHAAMLDAGLRPVPLLAVDKFNIDFGFPAEKLAIEYQGGNWHNAPHHRVGDRTKRDFLEANGWTLLVFPRIDKPQNNDAGNKRITLTELVETVRQHLTLLQVEW